MGSSSLAAVPEVGLTWAQGRPGMVGDPIMHLLTISSAPSQDEPEPCSPSELTLWQGRQIITKYVTSGDRHSEE